MLLHSSADPVNVLAEDSWLIMEKSKAKCGNHSPKLHCSIVCEPNRSTAQERGGREKERKTIKLQVRDTWDAKPEPPFSWKRCSKTISLGAVRVFQAVFQQWLLVNLTHVLWILYLIQGSTSPVATHALLLCASSGIQLCQNHSNSSCMTCLILGLPVCSSVSSPCFSQRALTANIEACRFSLATQT